MSDTSTVKRDRSPQFPYIGLTKAVERIRVLNSKVKRHEARVADIAKDWNLTATSSSTDRTVAALLAYGLVEDCGGSKLTRKIKLSDSGWRILEDMRPGIQESALAEAAMRPRVIRDYAQLWRDGRPDDDHALSQLKFEGSFTDEGAGMFLRVFDDALRYSGVSVSDTDTAAEADKDKSDDVPRPQVKPGDCIQWTSAGIDMFATPARVVAVSDDGSWLWVEGSETGIPVSDVQVVSSEPSPAKPSVAPPPPASVMSALAAASFQKPSAAAQLENGVQEDKFSLDEGVVTIRYPEALTSESVEELEQFLALFIRKAKRRAIG